MALLCGAGVSSARQDPATARAPQRASERAGDPATAPRVIDVVVKRFAFEPSTIEVTERERVRLLVKSADGVHGLQIKKFRVNKLIPRGGQAVTIDFVASAPGTFEILCSEECGEGHESMQGTLVVKAKAKGR
jgi:cytochrome c oxidase subunit 2